MLHETALVVTLAIGLWVIADVWGARGVRALRFAVMALAGAACIWVLGDILAIAATTPDELLTARRVLFFGSGTLPIAWVSTAILLDRRGRFRPPMWLLALPLLAETFFYATLYVDGGRLFLSGSIAEPQMGPVFWMHAGMGWALVAVGLIHMLRVAIREPGRRRMRVIVIAAGCLLPLLADIIYIWLGAGPTDPTPALMGVSFLAIRWAVIDHGFNAALPIRQWAVFDQLHTGIVLADLQGRVLAANPAARFIVAGAELEGRHLDELVQALRSDDDRVIDCDSVTLRGRFGGSVGQALMLTDRTRSARLEQQLRQHRKLESMSLMAAGAAHDFNNQLTAILAGSDAVRSQLPGEHPALETLEEVATAARSATHLANQLLAFGGRGKLEKQLIELSSIVGESEKLLARALPDRAALRIELAGDVPAVHADPGELQHVLMNLVLNAGQAIQSSGTVVARTFSADLVETGTLSLVPGHELRPGRHAILEVSDDGRGIAPADLGRIFDPFFTTRADGHGLGLSAVLGIVHHHGGGIEVESTPGRGTRFRVWLPTARRNEAPHATRSEVRSAAATDSGRWGPDPLPVAPEARRAMRRTPATA